MLVGYESTEKGAKAYEQQQRHVRVTHAKQTVGLSETISRLKAIFEAKSIDYDGVETWLGRDLQKLLDYAEWRNFQNVIAKAKEACERAGARVEDHFVDITKVIEKAKGPMKKSLTWPSLGTLRIWLHRMAIRLRPQSPLLRPILLCKRENKKFSKSGWPNGSVSSRERSLAKLSEN